MMLSKTSRKSPVPAQPPVERTCETCGRTFFAPASVVAKGYAKFCGRDCVGRPPEERLWPRVDKSGKCWEFTGPLDTRGYGMVGRGGKGNGIVRAHRLSWEIAYGPIPPGMSVLHRCDNRRCVRPDHLFLGSHQDNMTDMASKERSARTTLTGDDVRAMRASHNAGVSYAEIARRYGVTPSAAQKAILGQTWKHVPNLTP